MSGGAGGTPSWLAADPERLLAAGRTLTAVAEELDRLAAVVDRAAQALGGGWQGRASEAFMAGWASRRRELAAEVATYREATAALSGLAWALESAQRTHARVAADAEAGGVTLLPDGQVTGSPPLVLLSGWDLERRSDAVSAEAAAADQRAAGMLSLLAGRDTMVAPGPTAAALPVLLQAGVAGLAPDARGLGAGLDPALVAAWFAALSPTARQRLLATAPTLLGSLDGVPSAIRDQANRVLIARALADTERRLAASRLALAALRPYGADGRLEAEVAALERRQATLTALSQLPQVERFVLAFDPAGQGRAAIAVGDVAHAQHIGVLVPGTGTTLDSAGNLLGDAEEVRARIALDFGSKGAEATAVVAWLDYDAPDGILPNAVSSGYADGGAPTLTRFVDGLRATSATDPHPHLTVVGHSYGSTLTGVSAKQGLAADDVVFIGSPGVKAMTADELGLPDGAQVWAARGAADDIRYVFQAEGALHDGVSGLNAVVDGLVLGPDVPDIPAPEFHGPDPTLPGFGARSFKVAEWAQHSDYYKPDNESLVNIARIVVGRPEMVTLP